MPASKPAGLSNLGDSMEAVTRTFRFEGNRLAYDEYEPIGAPPAEPAASAKRGKGDRVVVLMPGLLFSRRMHAPLAAALAAGGHRVLCLDLLGHGDSDRPPEMSSYSMTTFGRQAIGLLDHVGVERAVLGGTSLGANAALEAAAAAPERVRGLLIEMPVLDNALLACAIGFTPLLVGLTFGAPVARLAGRAAKLVPRGATLPADMLLDWVSQDPKPSASVLQGLFFGRVAPPSDVRRQMKQPTLVIGHPRDPIHPFSDSDMLVRELPNARLVEASSILELRLTPERLTGEIVAFMDECFRARGPSGGRRRSTGSKARSATRRRPST
jgi:pimeloyl-ACP methyl ester carboxylesterase